jgi:hypothetical protein
MRAPGSGYAQTARYVAESNAGYDLNKKIEAFTERTHNSAIAFLGNGRHENTASQLETPAVAPTMAGPDARRMFATGPNNPGRRLGPFHLPTPIGNEV